jgi:hypothetical protein
VRQSTSFTDFLVDLVDDPARLAEYRTDREQVLTAAELTEEERAILRSGDPARLQNRMVATSEEEVVPMTKTVHERTPPGEEEEEGGGTIHEPPEPPEPEPEPEPEPPRPEPPPEARHRTT